MLIELINRNNYQSYNVSIAKMFNVNTAIYLNTLLSMQNRAFDNDYEYFSIDRQYVESKTALVEDEQILCEKLLIDSGILAESKESYKVNIDVITSLFLADNEQLKTDLDKLRRSANKKSNKDFILANVKKRINENYPEQIKNAYCDWLNMVNAKFNFVSNQLIDSAQSAVDRTANGLTEVAVNIINFATAQGWKDMEFAAKEYTERYGTKSLRGNVVVENAEVKKDIAF